MRALQSQRSVWMSNDITGDMNLHNLQVLSMGIALLYVEVGKC